MKAKLVWGCLAVFVVTLLLMIGATFAHAQIPQGPIATPQLNTDFYVGQVKGFYSTIQNTVTLRCAAPGLGSRVIVPAGSPADGAAGYTISAVTGGCAKVPIIDLRGTLAGVYQWGTSYTLQGFVGIGTAGQIAQFSASGNNLAGVTMSGDATMAVGGAVTLATVNAAPGSCGNASNVSIPTINGKGLTTACTTAAINPTQLNGAAIPLSAVVLASNAARQLIPGTVQGNGTAVQMAAGAAHVANDLLIYDANGNAIDSNVLISNVATLNAVNSWTGPTTSFTINSTNTGTTANSVSGANGGVKQWSISDLDGTTILGAPTGGQTVIVPASVTGENVGVTEWQASNITGAAFFNTLQAKSKIVNGAGLQVATGPGCTTSAAALATCNATITLSPVEPDVLYNVIGCEITGAVAAFMANSGAFTTNNFAVAEYATTASGATGGTISCLVVHN